MKSEKRKVLRYLSISLVGALLLFAGVLWNTLFLVSLPKESAVELVWNSASARNSDKAIEISWDKQGVAQIESVTENGAYFALGYAHARDRLWQLELQRRTVRGSLAEVLGKQAVADDVWMKTLGIYPAAEKSYELMPSTVKESLNAYAEGVNHWINGENPLPFEFKALGVEPSPWTAIDSVAWIKYFGLSLGSNYRDEIKHFVASQYLTDQKFSDLFPEVIKTDGFYSHARFSVPAEIEASSPVFHSGGTTKVSPQNVDAVAGSNAWVVSGDNTKSGRPLIANDPHLGFQLPSTWYAASLSYKNNNVRGMGIVGVPVIIFGSNDYIAWGGTSMMADVQDLYYESQISEDPDYYLYDGEYLPFETEVHTINVKSDFPSSLRPALKPVDIVVRKTLHGPVITDFVKGTGRSFSLKWVGLDAHDSSFQAFWQINKARNKQEFLGAASYLVSPALNLFYIDKCNNIGMVAAGKIPVRRMGNGSYPMSGSTSSTSWSGYVDFEEMPKYWNPESGFLVNANNKNTREGSGVFISSKFDSGERAERIESLLKAEVREKISLDYTRDMQRDVKDLSVSPMLELLNQKIKKYQTREDVVNALAHWDGQARSESIGATVFYSWMRHIRKSLFEDELKSKWNRNDHNQYLSSVQNSIPNKKLVEILQSEDGWCDDITTEIKESCDHVVESAYLDMLNEIEKLKGARLKHWRWGEVQKMQFSHAPFSEVRLLESLFRISLPSEGAAHTVNVAASYFDEVEGYIQVFGAAFRQIIELEEGARTHLLSAPLGQSGQVFSANYKDLAKDYLRGNYFEITSKDVAGATTSMACTAEMSGYKNGNI